MEYLNNYLLRISSKGNPQLAKAIEKTASDIVPQYISNFSFSDHVNSLLVGDVQSGKTSHMFGIMCAAADEGFCNFVLLTTDNVILQQQTFKRAKKDLTDFCICDETDYLAFQENNMRKPSVIILKKNSRVLKQWKNNFSSTSFCLGNPLFIVDDEADAASLNTLINKKRQSTINKTLSEIKLTASSSIYMQVTGTPQAILLQTLESGWKPYFTYYFNPGNGYLGGNFFFKDEVPTHIILTDNNEAAELLVDDEFPENGLKTAVITHLLSSAQIFLEGGTVSNFLIHPSVKTSQHSKFAEKVGDYLNEINISIDEPETKSVFEDVYQNLKLTKSTLPTLDILYNFVEKCLGEDKINILVINSITDYDENVQYEHGINIIIGGNSLGRGVTFPQLQTIYYCRVAKSPQADTMWQHARMFGYDRNAELMRVFIPPILYKLFSDINQTNNSIVAQIQKRGADDVKLCYPTGLKPTRKNVLDSKLLEVYSGGINYFPFYATNKCTENIDDVLTPFSDGEYMVSLNLIVTILNQCGSETDDWKGEVFSALVKSIVAENPIAQGHLIVRRDRDIARGTGTLLSPNDRRLGDSMGDKVVLTVYKVTGNKGWDEKKIWIPNIKFPGDSVYYSI